MMTSFFSASLGLIRLKKGCAGINIMASGRIVVKNATCLDDASRLLDDVVVSIRDSGCFLASK